MKTILLVDDNKYLLDLLSMGLSIHLKNYTIMTAANGDKAVKLLESKPVDYVVTDLQMPVMDGYELIEHTKKNYPSVPVVVITGNHAPEVEKRVRLLGATLCLRKPFQFKKLADTILSALETEPRTPAPVESFPSSVAEIHC
jgi:CheY-like chemotaxis protein